MPHTIRITAALRIHSPLERVREQYRDIDHHIDVADSTLNAS